MLGTSRAARVEPLHSSPAAAQLRRAIYRVASVYPVVLARLRTFQRELQFTKESICLLELQYRSDSSVSTSLLLDQLSIRCSASMPLMLPSVQL